MKVEKLLLLGMGSIMRALLELLYHEKHHLLQLPATCVCPEDIPNYILKFKPDLQHINAAITESNVEKLIRPLLDSKVLVIDLTVNVETIDIIVLCKRAGAMYMNTSLEKYNKDESGIDIEKTTLYHQEICLRNAIHDIIIPENPASVSNSIPNPIPNPTILHSMGMNPGAISSLMYQAIESYCKLYRPDLLDKIAAGGNIGKVASQIVDVGHISEYDNQSTRMDENFKSGWMINSWSSPGYVAEGLCASFISSEFPIPGYTQSKFNPRMYYSPTLKSMDCTTNSFCLYPDGTPFEYVGRMITHFEVVSLSEYMALGNYVPRLSYVYSSSPISQKCLEDMRVNNYKEPTDYYVFNQSDVINKDSFDSLGACVYFRDGRKFWCGTVLTNNHTMKLLGAETLVNATQLQVAIAVLAGIEWMLENPTRGVITAEEIPHKYIIRRCIPYWGNFFCREILANAIHNYNDNYRTPGDLIIDSI